MPLSLHAEALCWLRYAKRLPIVATEVGTFNADVIGMNTSMCIEVEVKKSISDLRAEFKNKVSKHHVYKNADAPDYRSSYVPNYLYYFAPAEMAEKAEEVLRDQAPKAGLAVLKHSFHKTQGIVEVVKRPSKLHGNKPSLRFVQAAVMRMASEICISRMALDRLRSSDLVTDIVAAAAAMEGALDFENPEASLESRGKLLAKAFGVDWDAAPFEVQAKYVFAAQTFLTARNAQVVLPSVIT